MTVLRDLASDIEDPPNSIPETKPGVVAVCNDRGIVLDRHVKPENGKVCTRCKAQLR